MQNAPDKPRPRTYHVGSAIVVAAPMPDGTWLATYPTFIASGATEEEALLSLSAAIAGTARAIASLAPEPAGIATCQQVAPTLGPVHELALVWAKSEAAARMFFGAPTDAAVTVIKERPETDEERARFHHNAKLFGVAYHKRTREFVQATAGARAPRTARIEEIAPPATLAEALTSIESQPAEIRDPALRGLFAQLGHGIETIETAVRGLRDEIAASMLVDDALTEHGARRAEINAGCICPSASERRAACPFQHGGKAS